MNLPKSFTEEEKDDVQKDPFEIPEPKKSFSFDKLKAKVEEIIGGISTPKKQFVLFIGDEGAILVLMQAGRVSKRVFAAGPQPEHTEEIIQLLEKNSSVPVSFLIDMMDQSYVRHSMPPVSILSVGKLVKRRLQRDFSPDDITGAFLLGRDKANRNEWNYLLISLANSVLLQQWFDAIFDLPNRFLGVYLVPLEAQGFIKELSAQSDKPKDVGNIEWKLLVSHDKVSGFRQIVLKDDVLVFTRLTQATDVTPGTIAANIEQEILNTIEYLRRLSYQDGAGLELYVVSSQDVCEELRETKINASVVKCYTPHDVSGMLGLEQAALEGDRFADVVLASRFGRAKKHALKLLPSFAEKLQHMYLGQIAARTLLLVSLIWGGISISGDVVTSSDIQADIDVASAAQREVRQSIEKAEKTLGALGEDQGDVLNIATLYRGTLQDKPLPLDFVLNLAQLNDVGHYVEAFNWDVSVVDNRANRGRRARVETAKEEIVVTYSVRFEGHNDDRKAFIEMAKNYIDRARKHFTNYDVDHEPLPGMAGREERMVLNFDEEGIEQDRLEAPQAVLKMRISGPKPNPEDGEVAAGQ